MDMIRVGRRVYSGSSYTDPSYPGFTPVHCLTRSSKYGAISPYELKDAEGRIMENIWQAHKIYECVPKSRQTYSRYDSTVIWDYPLEVHMREDEILPPYWVWRDRLMRNPWPVRYPVGFHARSRCRASIVGTPESYQKLDYIQARKEIYFPVYAELVKSHPMFLDLQRRVGAGENLLIIEVDGPHQESLGYYQTKYGVPADFIVGETVLVTPSSMNILLHDPKHPFGHGYCLAMCLLEMELPE